MAKVSNLAAYTHDHLNSEELRQYAVGVGDLESDRPLQ